MGVSLKPSSRKDTLLEPATHSERRETARKRNRLEALGILRVSFRWRNRIEISRSGTKLSTRHGMKRRRCSGKIIKRDYFAKPN